MKVGRITVVTDSTAGLPGELVRELDIRVVPELLIQGGQVYRDGVDIMPAEVYRRLRAGQDLFTSAAPSVPEFLQFYQAAARQSSGILSIHMSPDLSSTYNTAWTAGRQVEGIPVHVFNCNTAAIAQGFVVLAAARAAAAGASLDEVVRAASEVAAKIRFFFTLDTFKYLHRSGRIRAPAAWLGDLLEVRPVLFMPRGTVEVFTRRRTKHRAIECMLEQIAAQPRDRPLHAAIAHADVPEEAEELRQIVAGRFSCVELLLTEFTPVVGAHTGPGLLGIAFYSE
jgi:DegV family protein with EDD domain